MPKSKRDSSRKKPIPKDAEQSVVPQAGGSGWTILDIGSPVLNSSPLKGIKIDPDPPNSYPEFCAWLVQILGFVRPIVESGQPYDDHDEFEYLPDVQPHVKQLKTALTNAAHRIKHFPALGAKCDTYCAGGLPAYPLKLRRDIDRGTVDFSLLERISDGIELAEDDSALPAEQASVVELKRIDTDSVWPPDGGLHFRPLEFGYQGKAYRLTGMPRRLFEVVATARKSLHRDEIVERVWISQERNPERGTVRSCLSELKSALRAHKLDDLAKRIVVKDKYWSFHD